MLSRRKIPLLPGELYHIWTHANGSENLFRDEMNYRFFLDKYSHHISPVADTFAYCLLPNHLHLMVRIMSIDAFVDSKKTHQGLKNLDELDIEKFSKYISQQFSNLFNSYTKAYNKLYGRRGGLFIPNFKRKIVDSQSYYLSLMAYIHLNPVHHGFTTRPDDWPHTSWHAYCSEKRTSIKKDDALKLLGGRDQFFRLHANTSSDDFSGFLEEDEN